MTVIEAKQKLLYAFLELAKTAEVDFILTHPECINDEQAVLHLFVLSQDVAALKKAWTENEDLGKMVFWQDQETEKLAYLQPVHTPHLCLNGSTWSLPGWEDLPLHQGQFLVIHPLSKVKTSGWSSFWQRKRYAKIQKLLWQETWQDQVDLFKQIVPEVYASRILGNLGQNKESLENLLQEKEACIFGEIGESLAYFDLWGQVFYEAKFTQEVFTQLATHFAFLRQADDFSIFADLLEELGRLDFSRILEDYGFKLPLVEPDIEPLEVDSDF